MCMSTYTYTYSAHTGTCTYMYTYTLVQCLYIKLQVHEPKTKVDLTKYLENQNFQLVAPNALSTYPSIDCVYSDGPGLIIHLMTVLKTT